jgi:hypothetical protein
VPGSLASSGSVSLRVRTGSLRGTDGRRTSASCSNVKELIGMARVLSRRGSRPSFCGSLPLGLKKGRREGRAPADAHGRRSTKKHTAEPQVQR